MTSNYTVLKVYDTEDHLVVDLHVDEHKDPVVELVRVYDVAKEQLFPVMPRVSTKKQAGSSIRLSFDLFKFHSFFKSKQSS